MKIADFGLSAVVFLAEEYDGDNKSNTNNNELKNKSINNNQYTTTNNNNNNTGGQKLSGTLSPVTTIPTPIITPPALRRLRSVVGSPHYVAPEITASGIDNILSIAC